MKVILNRVARLSRRDEDFFLRFTCFIPSASASHPEHTESGLYIWLGFTAEGSCQAQA
jgi:hypothetical protein